MKVALLGGSFDPVHKAHIAMAKAALTQLKVEEVWFLVAKDTPLKDRTLTSFAHRVKMLEIALAPYRRFKICTIENTLEGKSYTIQTITALKKKYRHNFYFLMGEDQVAQLDKWKDIETLQKEVQLCAFARDGKAIQTSYQVQALHMDSIPVSSTLIRSGDFSSMPKGVRNYALQHSLYFEFVKEAMSSYRYEHTLRVAILCKEIAKANGLHAQKAYLCGLLHDINKEWKWMSVEEAKVILFHMQPTLLALEESIWHGYIGRFLATHRLGIQDNDILTAIENHVLGECKNRYAQITYVADKLDPNRDYDTSPLIALCKKDLQKGYREVQRLQKEYYSEEPNNG